MNTNTRARAMIARARKHGKGVPELAELIEALDRDADCPICERTYTISNPGAWQSLQHWQDGTMHIVCRACNSAAGKPDGNQYTRLSDYATNLLRTLHIHRAWAVARFVKTMKGGDAAKQPPGDLSNEPLRLTP